MQGGNYSDVPWCHKIFTCRKMCLTESIVSADVPKKWSKLHQFGNLLGAGIPLKCSRHSDSCFTISSHISNRSYCSCLTVTNAPMNRFKWLMCRPPPPISQSLFLYKQKIIFRYTRPDKDKGLTCFEQAGIHCPQCQQEGILPNTQYPLRVHSVRRGIY